MTLPSAEPSTTPEAPPIHPHEIDPSRVIRRLPGRNRTKADLVVYRSSQGNFAIKDYAARPWLVRQTLGRWLVRRECRAYLAARGVVGLPRFRGRLGAFALALDWIPAPPLSASPEGRVEPARFDRLLECVERLHERGVALADLSHRDVLLADDGSVHVVDLAAAWVLGDRPGRIRRRLFEHFRESDRFAVARLRARFAGEDRAAAVAVADPAVRAWHRRARRVKWIWDKLRGAPRVPPVDDHWRFREPGSERYRRSLARLRLGAVFALLGAMLLLAEPTPRLVAAGALVVALGEALRVWSAGHLVKNALLVTSGPYRFTRHPLYLGRLLVFTGLSVAARLPYGANWLILLAGCAIFFGYYLPRKERVEPARLLELHGNAFARYRREVPPLWPRFAAWPHGGAARWSARLALQNREHWMVAGLAAAIAFLLWRA